MKNKAMFNKISCYFIKMFNSDNIPKFFFFTFLVMGIIYSVIVPIMQVADEGTHVINMCKAIGADNLGEQYYEYAKGLGAMDVISNRQEVDIENYRDMASVRFENRGFDFSPKVSILAYFPMTIGFAIGLIFNLPILGCLQLGELGAVLFGAAMGYWALKIIPIKKELLCAIMLLPMNLHQCSSFSYDAVLLPTCFFLVSYFMYLKYRQEKVGWKELALTIALLAIISVIKILYILLGLLWMIIPMDHMEFRIGSVDLIRVIKKHKLISIAVAIVCVGIGMYLIRDIPYILALRACIVDLNKGAELIFNTLRSFSMDYVRGMIGTFGWLDSGVDVKFALFVIGVLLVLTQFHNENGYKVDGFSRIVFGGTAVIIAFLTIVCMITWTFYIYEIEAASLPEYCEGIQQMVLILGVQGRYFLPILPAALLVWDSIIHLKNKWIPLIQVIYYGIVLVYPISILIDRYWIV